MRAMREVKKQIVKEDLMKHRRIIASTIMTVTALVVFSAWMPRGSAPSATAQAEQINAAREDDKSSSVNLAQTAPLQDGLKSQPKPECLESRATGGDASGGKKPVSREDILEAEQRLAELGYWTGPIDGVMDEVSRQALVAFQKVEGRKRTGLLTAEELQALRTASRPVPIYTGFEHIEVDLSRQVLFVVDKNSTVTKALAISSGAGNSYVSEGKKCRAITPVGEFTVYNKIAGYRRAPLGLIYYPSYFSGGFAIHGSASVPAYPASHGCVRVPMFAARQLSEMIPIGTVVIVHDDKPLTVRESI